MFVSIILHSLPGVRTTYKSIVPGLGYMFKKKKHITEINVRLGVSDRV